jgi:hypothetical protein
MSDDMKPRIYAARSSRSTLRLTSGAMPSEPLDVLGPMAPENCVTYQPTVSPGHVTLIGSDIDGVDRVEITLAREDVTEWIKMIRQWLAWRYGALELTLLTTERTSPHAGQEWPQ